MTAMPPAGTIAIDVGGTFTDITLADAATGATWVAKTPSTPGDLSAGFITAIRKVLAQAGRASADILRVFHGTTTATNAILEGRTPPGALVTTAGFYAVRPDSAGPGFHRGGAGVIRDVRVLCKRAELATRMENFVVAPWGVAGGHAGRTGRILLNPGKPRERELPPLDDGFVLERGDVIRFETCGGGGWGDPLTRDPGRVRQDVARGFVTARGALEDYGVVLDPASLDVDKTATDETRRRRAGSLPLIDRGPGFALAEARWREQAGA